MSQLEYIRSLWPTGLVFYPHELAHWAVIRSWTPEAEILPANLELMGGRLSLPAAQVGGPVPEDLPLYKIRIAALAPLIVMFIFSLVIAPYLTLKFQSPEFYIVSLTVLGIGAPSSHDINTLFHAKETKEIGGFGPDYAEFSQVNISWKIRGIWFIVIVAWAAIGMSIFAYLS